MRPFDDDLEAYRRLLTERDEPERGAARAGEGDTRRLARREAAERRIALEPLRRKARAAEENAAKYAAEQQALERRLAVPNAFADAAAMQQAMKRRAELARLIAGAEADWFAAEEAIERAAAE